MLNVVDEGNGHICVEEPVTEKIDVNLCETSLEDDDVTIEKKGNNMRNFKYKINVYEVLTVMVNRIMLIFLL